MKAKETQKKGSRRLLISEIRSMSSLKASFSKEPSLEPCLPTEETPDRPVISQPVIAMSRTVSRSISRRTLLRAVLGGGAVLLPQTALARVLVHRATRAGHKAGHKHAHESHALKTSSSRHHGASHASSSEAVQARNAAHAHAHARPASSLGEPDSFAFKKGRAPAVLRGAASPLPVIVLDPGHGGKDPGAIGASGTYEKHVAIAAAHELRQQLLSSGRYQVVLTRTSDRFIPLEGRVDLAHRHRAQLFVSMHADALHDSSVRGASVYTLSSGASDSQTAFLARRENSADRFASSSYEGVSPEVAQILDSLVREETRHGSTHMASSVVKAFRNRIRLLSHPARHAGFVVLKSADIPSILVEMGFMSNHFDESALRQTAHRQQVATAMKTAIDHYFAGRTLARS